jgi:hypothetical protein
VEGIFGSLVILCLFVYFFKKGSDGGKKTKTTLKLNLQSPTTNANSNLGPPTSSRENGTYKTSFSNEQNLTSTTGEFTRSTKGFIPWDKCECGGEWVKHVNKTNGGRFFGCSRYPRCSNTRDKQQAKSFCSNGHARTSRNTALNSDGSRRCLVCRPLTK